MIVEELVSTLGLDISDKGLSQFRNRIVGTIGRVGTLVGVTVSAAAAVQGLLSAAGRGNQIARLSEATGVTTRRIQRLDAAAIQFGLGAGRVEGLISSFAESIAGIPSGDSNDFQEALGKLDVSPIDETTGAFVRADELILRVAESIASADGALRDFRIGAAQDLGIDLSLVRFFEEGREGIEALGVAAERNGLVIDERAIEDSKQLTIEMQRLRVASQTFLAEQGTPLIQWSTDFLQGLTKLANSGLFEQIKSSLSGIVSEAADVVDRIEDLAREAGIDVPEGGGRTIAQGAGGAALLSLLTRSGRARAFSLAARSAGPLAALGLAVAAGEAANQPEDQRGFVGDALSSLFSGFDALNAISFGSSIVDPPTLEQIEAVRQSIREDRGDSTVNIEIGNITASDDPESIAQAIATRVLEVAGQIGTRGRSPVDR